MPLYRERAALPALVEALRRLQERFAAGGSHMRPILVDDGSDDGSADLAAELMVSSGLSDAQILRHDQNRGLAAALRTGFAAGQGEVVCWLDADLSYPADLLVDLVALVQDGADVATVSPWHPSGQVTGVSRPRVLLSKGLSRACRLAARTRSVHTWSAMVRAWRRPWLARCLPERQGHCGVTESLLRAHALGARIAELPATLAGRAAGRTSMRVLPVIARQLGLLGAAATGRLGRASQAVDHG